MDSITAALDQIIGKPCWQVKHGHGSFVTAEFGLPSLRVCEAIPGAKSEALRKRSIAVRGEWHLWVYCCAWAFEASGYAPIHSESDDAEIARAARRMDGQLLTRIQISADSGASTFHFEDGDMLRTEPCDSDGELWMLYLPDSEVLTIKSGGFAKIASKNAPVSEHGWFKMTADILCEVK